MKKGVFVVIESSDGSDKSDLAARVVDMLMDEGSKVRMFHPGTLIGEVVEHGSNNKGLESHAKYLLYCASIWELATDIITALNSGTNVLMGHYVFSALVRPAAEVWNILIRIWFIVNILFIMQDGTRLKWYQNIIVGLPQPDAVIYWHENAIDQETSHRIKKKFKKLRNKRWYDVENEGAIQNRKEVVAEIIRKEFANGNGHEVEMFS